MKTTSLPRFIAPAALFAAFAASTLTTAQAQVPSVSTLRSTPNEVELSDPRVGQVIDRAEVHFKQGELNLKDNKPEGARDEFDKAVDEVLESGMDVRSNPRLQKYYLELVERVYRMEIPAQQVPAQQTALAGTQLARNTDGGGESSATTTTNNSATTLAQPVKFQQVGFAREQKFEPSPLDELSRLVLTEEEKQVSPEKVAELEDEINSSVDFQFKSNALIQQFINYYQGRGRSTMDSGLRRSGKFMRMARKIFREEGVPEDIAWLGQVESAWRPTAQSWAAASGLWQFIPGTGRQYGLRQTAWVDERNSFEKATRASARYLKWLHNRYRNWELAIGAYNTGEGNVDRAISRAGVADFWRIYPFIAQETRNYVPNILATILIAKKPEKYGFGHVRPEAPLSYDVVRVPSATSLQLIANLADTSVDYLRSINPELRRDVTPRGEAYDLRVPPGRGNQFVALLKRVPVDRRDTVARVITVAPGEELGAVAARTGTSVALLQQWNGGTDLKSGGKIVVPSGSRIQLSGMTRSRGNTAASVGSNLVTVKAKAGETVAQIAARYGASADDAAKLNAVTADEPLAAGREVRIPAQKAPSTSSRPSARRR